MFKAEHERMFQEANQGIIEIRKSEIEFYLRVSSALGTQAALVGGFTYLTFSQNLEAHYFYTYTVNAVYFVAAAMTIAFAIHVILTTMLVQILGPGLALNGPVGSMARAVEGMQIEQRQILGSFFLMMACFAGSTLLLFWVTMDFYSAVISSGGFLLCARYWLFYCGRIHRRFYWDRSGSKGQWRTDSKTSIDEPVVPISIQNLANQNQDGTTSNPVLGDVETGSVFGGIKANNKGNNVAPSVVDPTDIDRERPTFFERMSLVGGTRMSIVDRVSNAFMPGAIKKVDPVLLDRDAALAGGPSLYGGHNIQESRHRPSFMTRPSFSGFIVPPGAITVNPKDIACQGFIVMNVAPKGLLKQKNKWDRRYVVLNFRGQLFYYQTKQDFKTDPHSHLNPRPLSLDDFYVSTEKYSENDGATVVTTSTAADIERFWFTLIPKDDERYRNWQYRTDTEEELDMWLTALRQVSPTSFRNDL